jgi:hypothetical protein
MGGGWGRDTGSLGLELAGICGGWGGTTGSLGLELAGMRGHWEWDHWESGA